MDLRRNPHRWLPHYRSRASGARCVRGELGLGVVYIKRQMTTGSKFRPEAIAQGRASEFQGPVDILHCAE